MKQLKRDFILAGLTIWVSLLLSAIVTQCCAQEKPSAKSLRWCLEQADQNELREDMIVEQGKKIDNLYDGTRALQFKVDVYRMQSDANKRGWKAEEDSHAITKGENKTLRRKVFAANLRTVGVVVVSGVIIWLTNKE